ncbi:MAG: glycosyltransferase family 4 protein [Thermoleophilia bacterium]
MKLTVLSSARNAPAPKPGVEVVSYQDLKRDVVTGRILRKLFRYSDVEMLTYLYSTLGRLLPTALVLRVLTFGRCVIRDEEGFEQPVTLAYLAKLTRNFVRDILTIKTLERSASAEVDALSASGGRCRIETSGTPIYLRTDFAFGIISGGSLGHIAGVLNNLGSFFGRPVFVSSDSIPTVAPGIETSIVRPDERYRDLGELWMAAYNEPFVKAALATLGRRAPALVYQRYSLDNYAGLELARQFRVPFVCEYNGSEVWIARNWGRPLKYEALAEKIELANLHGADLVVVVSEAMRDELVERGIDLAKILTNPNGVDPEVYRPNVDGSAVRERYGLKGKTVVGFIGTFGRWHGAEVLADAFGRLLQRRPELRDSVRLFMVGDGVTMPEVCAAVERHGIAGQVVLTGLVPQAEGPTHLAAMDILASPHVPNPDGTPFFGSPTKLFEYMAMARGIVASDLDQIGEVLEHDRTGWLVAPGNADALVTGLETLIDNPLLRERLGTAARTEVVAKYTWLEHTRRIVEALKERCG